MIATHMLLSFVYLFSSFLMVTRSQHGCTDKNIPDHDKLLGNAIPVFQNMLCNTATLTLSQQHFHLVAAGHLAIKEQQVENKQ